MEETGKARRDSAAASLTLWSTQEEQTSPKAVSAKPVPALRPGDIWPVYATPETCTICSGELSLRVERSYAGVGGMDAWTYTAKGCCMTCGDTVSRELAEMTESVFEPAYWEGVFHVYILDELWKEGDRAVRENCVRLYLAHELKAAGEGAAFEAELKHLVPRDVWPRVSDFFRRVDRRWIVQDPVGAANVMTQEGRWRFRVEGRSPQEELAMILAARKRATQDGQSETEGEVRAAA